MSHNITQNQIRTSSSPASPLNKAIMDFLEYCEIGKNQSRNTIMAYYRYLDKFKKFAISNNIKSPKDITLEKIKQYRLFLNRLVGSNGQELKIVTQNYHLIALRAFLKYLAKQEIPTLAPERIELPKNPQRQVEFLATDELERLFLAIKQEKEEIQRLRDNALIRTLFSTGLRVSELASLKKDSINLERREFTVRGKGGKLRLVFLSEDATSAIKKYLAKRKDSSKALFVGHSTIGLSMEKQIESHAQSSKEKQNKTPGLTVRQIQRIIKKYCRLAGIVKKVSPHTLRHSFATGLLQNGADIRSVQTLLGHASITTTQIYTHITNQGLRDIHKKFHKKIE